MKRLAIILAGFALTSSAHAQMAKSRVVASNGIEITTNSDEFAARYEYTAPAIELRSEKGAIVSFRIAKITLSGETTPATVHGFIIYHGDWRHFERAVFKGGSHAKYQNTAKNVGSCRGGCSLSESFQIQLTPDEIDAFSENGKLAIQIRSQSGDTIMLELPLSYIEAVNEVAK